MTWKEIDGWHLVGRATTVYPVLMRLQLNYILNKDNYSLKLSWVYGTMLLSSINFLSLHTCYVWDGHKIVFISVNLVHKLSSLSELHIELYSVTSCTARAIWKDIKSSLGLTILRLIWSHFSVGVDSLLCEIWHKPSHTYSYQKSLDQYNFKKKYSKYVEGHLTLNIERI